MKKLNWKKLRKIKFVVVDDFPDVSNDPFFQKKHQEAKDFFERTGIPDFIKNTGKSKEQQ